jgi:hypothetical protein
VIKAPPPRVPIWQITMPPKHKLFQQRDKEKKKGKQKCTSRAVVNAHDPSGIKRSSPYGHAPWTSCTVALPQSFVWSTAKKGSEIELATERIKHKKNVRQVMMSDDLVPLILGSPLPPTAKLIERYAQYMQAVMLGSTCKAFREATRLAHYDPAALRKEIYVMLATTNEYPISCLACRRLKFVKENLPGFYYHMSRHWCRLEAKQEEGEASI